MPLIRTTGKLALKPDLFKSSKLEEANESHLRMAKKTTTNIAWLKYKFIAIS
jgi:hypothetical protein